MLKLVPNDLFNETIKNQFIQQKDDIMQRIISNKVHDKALNDLTTPKLFMIMVKEKEIKKEQEKARQARLKAKMESKLL